MLEHSNSRLRESNLPRANGDSGNGTAARMAFFHFGGRKASFFGDLHAQGDDVIGIIVASHSCSLGLPT
jgi:hypothetical protein